MPKIHQVTRRQRWTLGIIAATGATVTATLILTFVLGIVQNSLPFGADWTVREHYLAIGDSFSQGFMAGFFLCFFLSLVALAVGPRDRERPNDATEEPELPQDNVTPWRKRAG